MDTKQDMGFNTQAVKTHLDGLRQHRPLGVPITQNTNFQFASSRALGEAFHDPHQAAAVYTRFGHPTLAAAEAKLARLEGGEAAVVFDSGMGAITASLLAVLAAGDHVVAQREIFAQTFTFLDEKARSLRIETSFVDATDLDAVTAAIRTQTRVVYIETPSNPLLRVADIAAVARIAASHGALLFVDGTFASPYLQNPLRWGADLVLHSGTKFLGGHADIMCGVAVGRSALVNQIRQTQVLLGGLLDPHAAWLLLRSIKTLGVRVQRQCDTALALARFLVQQDGIVQVHYPWLEGSAYVELARKQMRGGGGVVSFEVAGGLAGARRFVDVLRLIPVATSLGGVESVIEVPSELDFSERELGAAASLTGIRPGLIRLSVGLEDVHDLEADLCLGVGAAVSATVLAGARDESAPCEPAPAHA
ncbi:MAG: aminotransferase class I/II-fold pyridoxal phosphate-dependent enzyme [Gemmatimonadetes bacterium]|nr:aminotransferase class I/II-fold pyridoxal phosphate-dependent enzyme [Gemmatimonadota bacterium]